MPPPSEDETSALARRALAGDLAARDELVDHHAGLAVKAARRHDCNCSGEDFGQAAMVGLIKAAQTYDPDRVPHVKFSTYATTCITREMRSLLGVGLPAAELPEDVPDECEPVGKRIDRAELYHGLREAMGALTPLERMLVVERFGLGGRPAVSRVALSMMTGVCMDRIRRIEASAMAKLRRYVDADT